MSERLATYQDFWPYYVSEHRDATCRRLHFVGTLLVFACLGLGVWRSTWFLAACPLAGYAFAWAGHFGFEKNRPATFRYPFWSLYSDFKMFFLTLAGRMPAELARAVRILLEYPGEAAAMGARARARVAGGLTWTRSRARLAEVYRMIAPSDR